MRASYGAVVADRLHDVMLARTRAGPPPRKRKGPGRDTQASFGKSITLDNTCDNTVAGRAAARAVTTALARAARLQRRASTLDLCGMHEAACRDRAMAEAIRTAVW